MKQFLVCALSVTAMCRGMPCHAQGTPATLTQALLLVRLTQARMDAGRAGEREALGAAVL